MTEPVRIMLVEDARMDVELTLDAFHEARLGNAVNVIPAGEAALDYVFGRGAYADRKKYPLPDLVLLDLKLPGMSGFEVLRQIKAAPGLKRLPVVILTSSMEESDRAMSYDNGANSYLLKPLSFPDFLEVVRKIGDYWLTLNVGPPMEV